MSDTSPEIAEMVRERYMRMTGEERLLIGVRMFDTARSIALSSMPAGLSENEQRRFLCERFYGAALAEAVYGCG